MRHVENGEALDHALTLHGRSGRELQLHEDLVLLNVVPDDALFCRYFEQARDVEDAEPFVVDGPAQLVHSVVPVRVDLLHCGTLSVLISIDDFVNALLSTPIDKVLVHDLHFLQIELASAAESENIVVVEVELLEVAETRRNDPFLELRGNLVLLRTRVTHESRVLARLRCGLEESHISLGLP